MKKMDEEEKKGEKKKRKSRREFETKGWKGEEACKLACGGDSI